MKKKVILSLLLLTASTVLFATLWPEKQQVGVFVGVQNELAAEAGDFTRQLLELASRNDKKNFATHCLDVNDRSLLHYFTTLRKSKLVDAPSWKVQKIDRRENWYMVLVETRNSGAYCCVLARNPEKNEWKFAGLYDE